MSGQIDPNTFYTPLTFAAAMSGTGVNTGALLEVLKPRSLAETPDLWLGRDILEAYRAYLDKPTAEVLEIPKPGA